MKHLLVSYSALEPHTGKPYMDAKRVNTDMLSDDWEFYGVVERYEELLKVLPKHSSIISITDLTKVLE